MKWLCIIFSIEIGYRTLGRGTLGRGTLGRRWKTRVDSWSGDLHRVHATLIRKHACSIAYIELN